MKDIFKIYKTLMDMATCVIFYDDIPFCTQLNHEIRRSLSSYHIPFDINLENLTDGVIRENEKLSDDELFELYEMVSDSFPPNTDRRLKTIRDLDTNIEKSEIHFEDLEYKAKQFDVSEETIYVDAMVFCEINQRIFQTVNKMESFVMNEEIYSIGTNYHNKLDKIFKLLPRNDLRYMKDFFQSLQKSDRKMSQSRIDSIKIANKLLQKRYDNEFPRQIIEKDREGESYGL